MSAPKSPFEAELQQLIVEDIERLQGNLESTGTIQSYDDYRHVVGQISALRRVINNYCDEANTLSEQR